ncbi:hypothetical protein ACJX0J_033902, partial [Zea mays]
NYIWSDTTNFLEKNITVAPPVNKTYPDPSGDGKGMMVKPCSFLGKNRFITSIYHMIYSFNLNKMMKHVTITVVDFAFFCIAYMLNMFLTQLWKLMISFVLHVTKNTLFLNNFITDDI